MTLLALLLVAYYLYCFQRAKTIAFLHTAAAPDDERDPPPLVKEFLTLSGEDDASNVGRLLTYELAGRARGQAWGHVSRFLFWICVRIYLTGGERAAVAATLSYNGTGTGISALAAKMFVRRLRELNEAEAAELVVALRAPDRLASPSIRREFVRRSELLRGLRASTEEVPRGSGARFRK